MSNSIIRAWKDPIYRESLSPEEQAALPDHPAGMIELDIEQLKHVAGGVITTTADTCTDYSYRGNNSCCPGGMLIAIRNS